MTQVKEHIEIVDKNMYSDLLASPDEKVNNVAKNFMSGSVEVKKYCKNLASNGAHQKAMLQVI